MKKGLTMSDREKPQGENELKTEDFAFTRQNGEKYTLKLSKTADTQEHYLSLYDSSGKSLGDVRLPAGISWENAKNYADGVLARIVLKGPEGLRDIMW